MKYLPDALILGGAGAFVCGVALLSVAAAFMVGGVFAIAFGWVTSKRD